jgi:hypothetical protein
MGQKARCSWSLSWVEQEASVGSAHWHSNNFLFPFGFNLNNTVTISFFKTFEICSIQINSIE